MKANGLRTAALLGGLSGLLLLLGAMLWRLERAGDRFRARDRHELLQLLLLGEDGADDVPRAAGDADGKPAGVSTASIRWSSSSADRMGIPIPRLWVIPEHSPNAFATGRNPSHSSVAFTQGCSS